MMNLISFFGDLLFLAAPVAALFAAAMILEFLGNHDFGRAA